MDISLYASFFTLVIALLCDPIFAVWDGCSIETETWLRALCMLLIDLSVSASLTQAKVRVEAIEKLSRQGAGQCPSLLRFVRELYLSLGGEFATSTGKRWIMSLLLAQNVARLCLLSIRQCRLFEHVSSLHASQSAK